MITDDSTVTDEVAEGNGGRRCSRAGSLYETCPGTAGSCRLITMTDQLSLYNRSGGKRGRSQCISLGCKCNARPLVIVQVVDYKLYVLQKQAALSRKRPSYTLKAPSRSQSDHYIGRTSAERVVVADVELASPGGRRRSGGGRRSRSIHVYDA